MTLVRGDIVKKIRLENKLECLLETKYSALHLQAKAEPTQIYSLNLPHTKSKLEALLQMLE